MNKMQKTKKKWENQDLKSVKFKDEAIEVCSGMVALEEGPELSEEVSQEKEKEE